MTVGWGGSACALGRDDKGAVALPFPNCHSGLDPESHPPLSSIKKKCAELSMRSRVGARDDKGVWRRCLRFGAG